MYPVCSLSTKGVWASQRGISDLGAQALPIPSHNAGYTHLSECWRLLVRFKPAYVTRSFSTPLLRAALQAIESSGYDAIHLLGTSMMAYLPALSRTGMSRLILGPIDDMVETAHMALSVSTRYRERIMWAIRQWVRMRYEYRTLCYASDVLFYNEHDRSNVIRRTHLAVGKCHLIRVPVEGPQQSNEPRRSKASVIGKHRCLFVGGGGSLFNRDAVLWFCGAMWPVIRQRVPDAEFIVVGAYPVDFTHALAGIDGVRVTGYVDDLSVQYATAELVVRPLRIGTGIKTATIEAMRHGKAIVSTSCGVSGLWNTAGLCIADDLKLFVDWVVTMLTNSQMRQAREDASRRLFYSSYCFGRSEAAFLDAYAKCLGSTATC